MPTKKPVTRKDVGLWTPARLAASVVVLALVALFGASSCNSTDESASKEPGTKSNARAKPAPVPATAIATLPALVRDAELQAVSGAPIKLADYSGKVLVLNLWATWCGPCRSEIPELVKLYQEFRPKGLEVVGLSTENPDASAEAVRKFVNDFNMNYRVGWATADVAQALMNNRNAIPQSFVISAMGAYLTGLLATTPPRLHFNCEKLWKQRWKIKAKSSLSSSLIPLLLVRAHPPL